MKLQRKGIIQISVLVLLIILTLVVIVVKYKNESKPTIPVTTTMATVITTPETEQTTALTTTEKRLIITTADNTTVTTTTEIVSETVLINNIEGVDEKTINRIAGICYGEAKGSPREEIAKVAWCICNRADAWGLSLYDVATAPNQFYYVDNMAYRDIVIDVLSRWQAEKRGEKVYRELGPEYLWFTGDGTRNHYRASY